MKRTLMVAGAAVIFVFIGLGFLYPVLKGQPELPPPACKTQYVEWHDSVYSEIQKLGEKTWEAPMMLSPLYPPRCAISPRRWRVLMWDLAHRNNLNVKETALLHKLERK
jgi:hypothetical protein